MGKAVMSVLIIGAWGFGAIGAYLAITIAPVPVLIGIIGLLLFRNVAKSKENKTKN